MTGSIYEFGPYREIKVIFSIKLVEFICEIQIWNKLIIVYLTYE